MRRRFIEAATPASVVAASPQAAGTGAAPVSITGRWRRLGAPGGTLEIAGQAPGTLRWTWEQPPGPSPSRAGGQGELREGLILLTGSVVEDSPAAARSAFSFELRMAGDRLAGTGYPPGGPPFAVEFVKDSP